MSFTVPATATGATLMFKKGPDCGIMAVNGERVDTFSETVQWEATMPLRLTDVAGRTTVAGPTKKAGKGFNVAVTGQKNSESSHDLVQIVGVAVFR